MRRALPCLLLLGCASQGNAHVSSEPPQVLGLGRPPGMPIGTGGASPARADLDDAAEPAPAELRAPAEVAIPKLEAAPAQLTTEVAPCSGCVELQVDVSDINQRDEFAVRVGGVRLKRVVWTLLVNFNSDQLAVQPFVDGAYGKYLSLHVNTFPLGTAVEVVQELDGKALREKAQHVGLEVGSSGAWTGNQTMSVFVAELRMEGAGALRKPFDAGPEGLEPRTQTRNPRVVFHAPPPMASGAR